MIAVGVVSALLGGAIFAAVVAALAVGAFYEVSRMTPLIGLGFQLRTSGFVVIIAASSIALLTQEPWGMALAVALSVLLPGTLLFRTNPDADAFSAIVATTSLASYIGLAAYAAIALRQMQGTLEVDWASDLGAFFTLTGDSTALGMAWTMVAIAATWLADTTALFVGRALGRTPLVPHVSPNKTMEGAAGSIVGAVIATVALVIIFGIPDVTVPMALAIGVAFAVVGIYGDLYESFIKRAAGAKDSGTLIPGHGGIFDRIDSLFPTLLIAWIIATAIHA